MNIFYSWQSDLENNCNRGFIKDALEKAIKQINSELVLNESDRDNEIKLDHDTKGITGTPDLATTIFDKISNSTIFIADISYVGDNQNRKISNPNVLIELGYALSKLGSNRVLCVLNNVTGSTNDLPFDLKHKRHPIQYSSKVSDDTTTKNTQKNQLVTNLKNAIKPIIDQENFKTKNVDLNRDATYQNIIDVIINSDSDDDWQSTVSNNIDIRYYKKNINLKLQVDLDDDVDLDDFREPWANMHPNRNATSYKFTLYYNNTPIDEYRLVSVDGGRAMLPLPKSRDDLRVSIINYKIAKIYDSINSVDEYMIRSGLILEKDLTK